MNKSALIRILLLSMLFTVISPVFIANAAINCLTLVGNAGLSANIVNQGDNVSLTYNLSSAGTLTSVQERKPADIILALDYSGSMAYPIDSDPRTNDSRLQAMQKASDTFLDELELVDQDDRVGLTSFSSTAPKYPNIQLNSSYAAIRNQIDNGRADGGTNIEQAMQVAQAMFATSESKAPKYMILLTDGFTTHYTYKDSKGKDITKNNDAEARKYALHNADLIGATDITIHTIALAQQGASKGNVDRALLSQIAAKTGGSMYDADNIEGLKQVFRTIVNEINEDASFSKIKISQTLPIGVELADTSSYQHQYNESSRELIINVEDIPYQGTLPVSVPIKVNSQVGQVQFSPATVSYKNLCGEADTFIIANNSHLDVQKVVWDQYLNTYISTKEGELRRYQSTGSQATLGTLDWKFNTNREIIEDIVFSDEGTRIDLYTVLNNINNPSFSLDLKPSAPTIGIPDPVFGTWLTGAVTVTASGSTMTALADYPGKFSNMSANYTANMLVGYEYRLNGGEWNSLEEPIAVTIENGTIEVAAIMHAISNENDTNLLYGHSSQSVLSIDNTPPELPQLSIVEYDEVAHQYTISVSNLVDKASGLKLLDGREYEIQCSSCDLSAALTYKTNNQFEISEKQYLAGQFRIYTEDQAGNFNTLPLGIDVSIQNNPTDNPWIQLTPTIPTIRKLSVRLDPADPYIDISADSDFFMEDIHDRYTSSNQREGLRTLDILANYELDDGTTFANTHSIMFNVVPELISTNISGTPIDNPYITTTKLANTITKISLKIDGLGSFVEIISGQAYQLQDIHSDFEDRANRLGRHQLIAKIEHTLRDGTVAIHEEELFFDVIPDLVSVHISEIPNDNPEITVTQLASLVDKLTVRLDGRGDFHAVASGSPSLMEDINDYYHSVTRREGWHKLEVATEYDLGSGTVTESEIINFEVVPNLVKVDINDNPTDNPNLTFTALTTAVHSIAVNIDQQESYSEVASGRTNKMNEIHTIFDDRDLRLGWHKLNVRVAYSQSDGAVAEHTFTSYYKVNPGIDSELRTNDAINPATKPILIHISHDLPVVALWGKLGVSIKERYYAITNTSVRPLDSSREWKVLRSDHFTVTESEKKDVYIHLRIVDSDGITSQDPPVPLYIKFNYKYDRY